MSDQYLWDRSGTPDARVAELETLLQGYAYKPPAARQPRWRLLLPLAIAASVLLVCGYAVAYWNEWRLAGTSQLIAASGDVTLDGRSAKGGAEFLVGQLLALGAGARARVRVGTIGYMDVASGSRLRLTEFGEFRKRFHLEAGTIQANINARPYAFVVDLPHGTAYDLGCAYLLRCDAKGAGSLQVTAGWVNLEAEGTETLVGAGAQVSFYPGVPPGVPVRVDASARVRSLVGVFNTSRDAAIRKALLEELLVTAAKEDRITLVNLLWRVEGEERARIYDQLAAWYPPPASVTRKRVMSGDWRVVPEWWQALGFGKVRKLAPRFMNPPSL